MIYLIRIFKRITRRLKSESRTLISNSFRGRVKIESNIYQLEETIADESFSFNSNNFNYIGTSPYWVDFESIPLRKIGLRKENNIEVIPGGAIINSFGEIILESTIFQQEYLHKLKINHIIYFNFLLPTITLDNVIVLSNYLGKQYYHWNMESLGRLALVDKNELQQYKILIDSDAPNFVSESLQVLFEIDEKNIVINKFHKLKVSHALILSYPFTRDNSTKMTNVYSPTIIRRINRLSKSKSQLQGFQKNIIISRKNATQRRILNIDVLKRDLPLLNLEVIYLEELSFQDQIQLFRNTNLILSTHGAGLVNLLYSENPIIIEFFPTNRYNRDAFYFYQISAALNFSHSIIEYEAENKQQDLHIEITHLNQITKILTEHNILYK